jgi:hypothetical protein
MTVFAKDFSAKKEPEECCPERLSTEQLKFD